MAPNGSGIQANEQHSFDILDLSQISSNLPHSNFKTWSQTIKTNAGNGRKISIANNGKITYLEQGWSWGTSDPIDLNLVISFDLTT